MEEKKGMGSLRFLGVVIISLALVISTYIASAAFVKGRLGVGGTITVTGSAKKKITSDYAIWTGTFSSQSKDLKDAYATLSTYRETVKEYLISKGVPANELAFLAIYTNINYVQTQYGVNTSLVDSYRLSQNVEIKTNKLDLINSISKDSTVLISKGIEFSSNPPQYFYTKIAEEKINMLALATKDARERAQKIAENTGTEIVALKKAKMGVFQIMPVNTNMVTDYGVDDTSSIDKEIMAVMNCDFSSK